jgi:hypothetical protein
LRPGDRQKLSISKCISWAARQISEEFQTRLKKSGRKLAETKRFVVSLAQPED